MDNGAQSVGLESRSDQGNRRAGWIPGGGVARVKPGSYHFGVTRPHGEFLTPWEKEEFVGVTCIENSAERAEELYQQVIAFLTEQAQIHKPNWK